MADCVNTLVEKSVHFLLNFFEFVTQGDELFTGFTQIWFVLGFIAVFVVVLIAVFVMMLVFIVLFFVMAHDRCRLSVRALKNGC